MGLQIRDERQMKALTGLSQAQFDSLLPVFSDLYRAAQQHAYEEGSQSGTRRRRPGGGSKGKLPTMVEKLLFVLYYYKTYPTFDVLGTQFAMARSRAHENLHKLSPILYDTLVHLELMPYRELATPEELKAALQGVDRLLIDATERAYHRLQDETKQREHYSGKKTRVAKLAGGSLLQALRDMMPDRGGSDDGACVADDGSQNAGVAPARSASGRVQAPPP